MQKRLHSGQEQAGDADEEVADVQHPGSMSEKYSGVKVKAGICTLESPLLPLMV